MGLFRKKLNMGDRLSNQNIGRWGEDQAARFLKKQGYKILKRNFKALGGEIDVVASFDRTLVFVEVKTQDGKGPIAPEMRVGRQKQRQIAKLAKYYLSRSKGDYDEVRLDIISVYRLENGPEIHHLKGAFGG